MSVIQKPRRQATACTSCRHRRVKCSRHHPSCLQCSKRKKLCEYIDLPSTQIQFITENIGPDDSSVPSASGPPETWKSLFEPPPNPNPSLSAASPAAPVVHGGALRQGRRSSQSTIGDQHHWSAEYQNENPTASFSPLNPVIRIGSLGDPFLSTLFNSLEPADEYHKHFENYVSTLNPILSLCDIATLRETYCQFWDTLSFDTSAELFVLVLATLYTGANNTDPSEPSTTCLKFISLYDMLVGALELPTYHVKSLSASLWLLQGVVIMNTFKASKLPPFTAYGFLPAAIRFAQNLKVHADQSVDNP
ncbi:hypothetical protein ONS95_005123 [Cadophora gregata]|uniref:uncharacterized protein n=1 Tax=Cadophora gregata TaxID=51156 RepID=UPI0026DAE74C|nr:uncharacterized protein ONS95_005123 [Cadophora gregata]KAK0104857.1 hypothetical protein ONS95_005123 [Cadophora gregata]KAK0115064.1 hypothetical protein ONS96_013534 [Cadophora gregata f. sp. sojae]